MGEKVILRLLWNPNTSQLRTEIPINATNSSVTSDPCRQQDTHVFGIEQARKGNGNGATEGGFGEVPAVWHK